MDKQVYNNGFTLIEVLLVLFVISMLMLIFPMLLPQKSVQFSYELHTLKAMIQMTQLLALEEHRSQSIVISSSYAENEIEFTSFVSGMSCTPTVVSFAANGKVTHAQTIRCYLFGKEKQIVIELGSGCMYVR